MATPRRNYRSDEGGLQDFSEGFRRENAALKNKGLKSWVQKTLAEWKEFLHTNECPAETVDNGDSFKFLPQGLGVYLISLLSL